MPHKSAMPEWMWLFSKMVTWHHTALALLKFRHDTLVSFLTFHKWELTIAGNGQLMFSHKFLRSKPFNCSVLFPGRFGSTDQHWIFQTPEVVTQLCPLWNGTGCGPQNQLCHIREEIHYWWQLLCRLGWWISRAYFSQERREKRREWGGSFDSSNCYNSPSRELRLW